MATKRVTVHPGEARTIAAYLDERDAIVKMLTGAVTLVCARESIPVASLSGVEGDELVLEVPDDQTGKHPQDGGVALLNSTETGTTGAAVVGDISPAPTGESGSESTPAGNNGHLTPVVDAPDAGKPAGDGSTTSRGAFRHTEGA